MLVEDYKLEQLLLFLIQLAEERCLTWRLIDSPDMFVGATNDKKLQLVHQQ
jgi:hypothetical protein